MREEYNDNMMMMKGRGELMAKFSGVHIHAPLPECRHDLFTGPSKREWTVQQDFAH